MRPQYGRPLWVLFLVMAFLAVGLAPVVQAKLNDPEKLVSFLKVKLPGWKVKDGYPKLERATVKGHSYVEAQVIFTSGKSAITAVIMEGDIAATMTKVRGFTAMADADKYCRDISIQGFATKELYDKKNQAAFLFIMVADHCLIPVEGSGVSGTKDLKALANKINLKELAALVR